MRDQVAAPLCECLDGYFRAATEYLRYNCTRKCSVVVCSSADSKRTNVIKVQTLCAIIRAWDHGRAKELLRVREALRKRTR